MLEEYWKSIPAYTKDHPLTCYILLATGLYHWRRGNINGAYRTLVKAEKKIVDFSTYDSRFTEEIDYNQLVNSTKLAVQRIKTGESFSPFQIELKSEYLLSLVGNVAHFLQLLPVNSDAVIHKHMLRDRTDILIEREKKKGRPL